MAADAEGFDLGAVPIPITGFAAVQLDGAPVYLDSAQVKPGSITVPEGYVKIGLFKQDGGPQDAADDDDAIEFFQDGYQLAGNTSLTVQINLAEMNNIVRRLITGKTPDENGMVVVDRNIPDATFPMLTVTKFKNGKVRVRNGLARVTAVEADQEERGSVKGQSTTFRWLYNDALGGYYREWYIDSQAASGVGG